MSAEDDPPAGGGGAADLVADPPAGDPPPAGPPPAGPPAADPPPAGDPEWLAQFSAEGGDADNPSHRDWLKSKGFKSLDDVAKSYREAEKAIHAKGVAVPGDKATEEEIAAFHKAIGVPEKIDGYEVKVPDGQALDEDLMGPLREVALKAGVPKAGFEALSEAVIKHQLDTMEAARTAENGDRDALLKEWGAHKDAKMADVSNAMRALGLKGADVAAMQRGFAMQYGEPGSRRTLELLQKLGAGLAEDTLLNADGPRRFGVTGEEAQAEIDRLIVDRAFGERLAKKEPDAVARWNRLNAAVAADRDRKAKES